MCFSVDLRLVIRDFLSSFAEGGARTTKEDDSKGNTGLRPLDEIPALG